MEDFNSSCEPGSQKKSEAQTHKDEKHKVKRQKRVWAVVPAAGVGRRMGSDVPKQYLPLQGLTVIEHSLARLLALDLEKIIVVIGEDDNYWHELDVSCHPNIETVIGGDERCHSVLNGLKHLIDGKASEDWVIVHDAARPCVRVDDIKKLFHEVDTKDGGLLGVSVKDTMKRTSSDGLVLHSVDRQLLWHAYTPQLFPVGPLFKALEHALSEGQLVTDEASAMEAMGYHPKIVEGHRDNIKITHPVDLPLADWYLQQQSHSI